MILYYNIKLIQFISSSLFFYFLAFCWVEDISPPPTKKAKKSLASFLKRSTISATVPIDPTAAIEAEQATSSPSERIFSASGNIVSCERSCLKHNMVNKLVFLAKNL